MITCAGAMNVDRIVRLTGPAQLGTSNPAVSAVTVGGVARNVAEHLAAADVAVALVSAVGDDPDGCMLLEHARGLGIDTSAVAVGTAPTGSYVAVVDHAGELVIGAADVRVIGGLTPSVAPRAEPLVERSAWLFVDANLSRQTIVALVAVARRHGVAVAANAVSVPKAPRLRGVRPDLLFCSRDEAEALGPGELAASAGVVVTQGAGGVWWRAADGSSGRLVGAPRTPADPTGAGDALVAGTLAALVGGASLADAVAAGMARAETVLTHLGAGVIS